MNRIRLLPSLMGLLALATTVAAQTTNSTGFAPSNFSDFVLTSLPSNATGNNGISTVYSTAGQQLTFGTGGSLVNPTQFNYTVTGPNTATISLPASGNSAAATTNLVFTGQNAGTYTTVQGSNTTTGHFSLAEIPFAAPLSNVSVRTTLTQNNSTIIGFVIAGTQPRRVLIRGVGPGLASLGVSNPLASPTITLYRGSQALVSNSSWGTLSTGTTAGTGGTSTGSSSTSTGTSSGSSSSTSSSTSTSSGTFTGTFSNGETFTTQLATSDDFTNVGAFPLQIGSRDAAIVATLPPGPYTVLVSGVGATTMGSSSGGATVGVTASSSSSGSSSGTGSTLTGSGGTTGTGSSTGTGSTTGGVTAGTGSTTGGTSSGTTSTTGSLSGIGSLSGTGSTSGSTGGDVLVEVYFLQ